MEINDREIAGIRCREVLAVLSDYLDGDLEKGRAETIEAHLRGCDWCERFGGEFSQSVKALRGRLPSSPVDPSVLEAIRASLSDHR